MKRLPKRRADTHKGDYGRVLVFAGSRGMAGAAVLASEGAYRAGAGLVELACPEELVDVLSVKQTCGIVRPLPARGRADRVLELAGTCDAAVIGPGLSRDPAVAEAVREVVVGIGIPFVLDADGLNAFVDFPELLLRGQAPRILTPHPGEASRLLKRPVDEIQQDRRAAVKELAERHLAVVVLKGHRTLIADGKGLVENRTGNPGMASAGSGDVLAGVLGALLGQRLPPFDAARLGVRVHGRAGDLAARRLGEASLMATDLLEALPRAFRST
jgi:hydroxyethylthiazole kinase-like uncharacterized protein yjeF